MEPVTRYHVTRYGAEDKSQTLWRYGESANRASIAAMKDRGGERVERRLAAILAADVAGYSRLMEADEEGTLAALRAIRRERVAHRIGQLAVADIARLNVALALVMGLAD